jgi:hypothetical protein
MIRRRKSARSPPMPKNPIKSWGNMLERY